MTATALTALECSTERAVLNVLVYFELFSYPLTAQEVFHYCSEPFATEKVVAEKLQNLVSQGIVYKNEIYFQSVKNDSWVLNRLECNQRADSFLPIARRQAKFIGKFPYVRGVFVSGSLSKHSMRIDSDIDFFIITAPGRLWLTRTLLILFKKIFLFNSHKYFCVNYFIDTDHLAIEEQNRFTATETVTLLPLYGREYFDAFCDANTWAWVQYPNFLRRNTEGVPFHSKGFLKKMLEKMLLGRIGTWLDEKAMRLTLGFWQRKFKHLDKDTFEVALKSRRYVSKHHPLHFQQKVLEHFEARVRELVP